TRGVSVTLGGESVSIKGPKGGLTQSLPRGITAAVEEGKILVRRRDDTKSQRALHGLARALLANAVEGVTKGFSKDLEIHGVGYRAQVAGQTVPFHLGFTHPLEFHIPSGL